MKIPGFILPLFTLPLLLRIAGAQQLLPPAANAQAAEPKPAAAEPVVRASSTSVLPDGRRLTIQRIDPPARTAPVPAAVAEPGPVISPEARAVRRAEWAAKAPLATYILPVMATVYPGGITHLSWRHQMLSGEWKEMQAWSRTDFTSLNVVSDIEVARVRYWIFASVIDGTLRTAGKRAVPAVDSLPADGSFVLINGDVAEAAALAPIQALHEHYRQHGPALDAAWKDRLRQAQQDEEERQRAAPPQDIVVRYYEVKPVRGAMRPADAPAQSAAAEAQPETENGGAK